MPQKRPGLHHAHVTITTENFRTLQKYCVAGVERLTASSIINLLMTTYIKDFVAPRMRRGGTATWSTVRNEVPQVAAKVAHQIEPTAFENPER